MIADLCIKHDVICFSDEVYEWLTYDGAKHIKMGKKNSCEFRDIYSNFQNFKYNTIVYEYMKYN